ncbi:hypothetical protein C481_01972 [Natrialba asiatica DSM 12278]|uniref:Uncharacterized protein n=2 Tax=Natrialba asiatica TaxID=64602 RepID=M0B4J9_NATA1|nr:hypothetical protein C481_01972 [Natrialba asiatica DSM 12278]
MTIDTLYYEGNIFDARDVFGPREESHTLITDEETAASEFRDVEQLSDFTEGINFDESYILVVQNGMRSEDDLELGSINRIEDGLQVAISIDKPLIPDHDDLITHTLLIRITDEKSVFNSIDVSIDGH